jgi:hypothetical protein
MEGDILERPRTSSTAGRSSLACVLLPIKNGECEPVSDSNHLAHQPSLRISFLLAGGMYKRGNKARAETLSKIRLTDTRDECLSASAGSHILSQRPRGLTTPTTLH